LGGNTRYGCLFCVKETRARSFALAELSIDNSQGTGREVKMEIPVKSIRFIVLTPSLGIWHARKQQ